MPHSTTVYHIVALTLLLNMMVGVMSNTYTHIQENVAEEWKFARSEVVFNKSIKYLYTIDHYA